MDIYNESKILVTGGGGLLGTELKKLMPNASFPNHAEFDVTNYDQMSGVINKHPGTPHCYDTIVHAAAITSPPIVNENTIKGLDTNIIGTCNIVKLCSLYDMKLVYISTDYVYPGSCGGSFKELDPIKPVNKYGWSKLGGECAAMLYDKSLIIRTSFTPVKFPYEKAFVDQISSRDRVDYIAKKIVTILNKNAVGIVNIGGKRQSVYTYAKTLKSDVRKIERNDVNFNVPYDVSMDCTKYNSIIEWIKE